MNILKLLAEAFQNKFPKRPSFAKRELETGNPLLDHPTLKEELTDADPDNNMVGLTVGVEYKDENEVISRRWVSIINFANSFAGYHSIRGYCFMSKDLRSFRIDRIINLFNENGESYDVRDLLSQENSKQSEKPSYTSVIETKHWSMLRDSLRVLIAVARSDGYLHPKEVLVIMKYAELESNGYGYPLNSDDTMHLENYIKNQQPTGEVVASCLNRLSEMDSYVQDIVLENLQKTIYADGILAPQEIEISAEVYRRFNT